MWLVAGLVGIGVVVVTFLLMAAAARLLPPGRGRDLAAFIPNCLVLLRRLRGDGRLPRRARFALGAALAYVLSPIQLIPNFIPVIGQTDDVVVVTLALRYACRKLPPDEVAGAWPGDPAQLERLLGKRRRPAEAEGELRPSPRAPG
jgi:uncharacterized membrane protein YkvA (DUF1232 family)